MEALPQLVVYFTLYSFVGWIWEVFYVHFITGKWINRGFLRGPYLPFYGFGALVAIAFVVPLPVGIAEKFVICALFATVVEYFVHFMLEKVFSMELWDYRDLPFNIHGRVCLFASLAFAAMALLAAEVVHPTIVGVVQVIPPPMLAGLALFFSVAMILDLINTVILTTTPRRKSIGHRLLFNGGYDAIGEGIKNLFSLK